MQLGALGMHKNAQKFSQLVVAMVTTAACSGA